MQAVQVTCIFRPNMFITDTSEPTGIQETVKSVAGHPTTDDGLRFSWLVKVILFNVFR